jgi:hypothetical protein
MRVKFLLEGQTLSQLISGRAVEQWLGHDDHGRYRVIRWIRIDPGKDRKFNVALFESFDDGTLNFLDVYAFERVDPDALSGTIAVFDSAELAVQFAVVEYGAKMDRFVGSGCIQDLFADFLEEYGVARHSA